MGRMEIVLLSRDSLRIKGKRATLVVDPRDKAAYDAVLLLRLQGSEVNKAGDGVLIEGPGEYEVGGVKISGFRIPLTPFKKGEKAGETVYSMRIDGVSVLVGRIGAIEKLQQKLEEHNIVIVYEDEVRDASFITGVARNVVIFYGEKGREVAEAFGKESVKEVSKYVATVDKLPVEVETVVLL